MTHPILQVLDTSYGDITVELEAAKAHGVDVVDRDDTSVQADGVLVQYAQITGETLDAHPTWAVVGRYGVGYDTIDVAAATERGVAVVNVPDYCEEEVATHAAALVLASVRRIREADTLTRAGGWPNWHDLLPVPALSEATLSLIGVGRIGRKTINLLRAFFGRVVAYDPYAQPIDGVEMVDLDTAVKVGDVISLHCPLTPDTHHIINADRLAMMKPHAHLVNVSRGGLVDSVALAAALRANALGGAAVDVLECEPPSPDDPLLSAPRLTVTNHLAWYSARSEPRLRSLLASRCAGMLVGVDAPSVVNRAGLAARLTTAEKAR
ncbi:MAG: C-terminal binding protein [Propionibacteriaceae bacterium]|jgi:D-3-phosphoglycerate dehydrogenase|nr:C-terminal binding protein [Propionibacteriaceae bacterium]